MSQGHFKVIMGQTNGVFRGGSSLDKNSKIEICRCCRGAKLDQIYFIIISGDSVWGCLHNLEEETRQLLLFARVRISARVRESTLAKTPANESTRVQWDSRKLPDVSHKLNTGESKDSCKLHPGESKWTLVAFYEILPLLAELGPLK